MNFIEKHCKIHPFFLLFCYDSYNYIGLRYFYRMGAYIVSVSVKGNEQLTSLLNDWYRSMLSQQVIKATNLKKKIDEKINKLSIEPNQER